MRSLHGLILIACAALFVLRGWQLVSYAKPPAKKVPAKTSDCIRGGGVMICPKPTGETAKPGPIIFRSKFTAPAAADVSQTMKFKPRFEGVHHNADGSGRADTSWINREPNTVPMQITRPLLLDAGCTQLTLDDGTSAGTPLPELCDAIVALLNAWQKTITACQSSGKCHPNPGQ